jgi:imidazolonepropionase
LTTADELKQLEAIHRLDEEHPMDVVATFLGAHAVPTEYQGRTDAYVDLVIEEMLPAVAKWGQAHNRTLFCDVFCEAGVFDVEQSRRILTRARALNFGLKIHADEFERLGGVKLACELGAISADHLAASEHEDLSALGKSSTIPIGLPGSSFGLGHPEYMPAKEILAAGASLALATDFNPGTCWCESIQFVIALATRYLALTPAQALSAVTLNAAYAIGLGDKAGSLAVGRQADLLVLDIPTYRHLGYRFGTNLVETVIKKGRIIRR